MTLAQIENAWAAFGHAERIGLPLNEAFDINFARGDLADPTNRARSCLQAYLKSARQWIERKGCKTACVWVLENIGDADGYGLNAHVLMHLPEELRTRFHQLKRGWATRAGLDMSAQGVIVRKALPTAAHAKGKLKYMCKDIDPALRGLFGTNIERRDNSSDQPVHGKKLGVSRNIDVKARASIKPLKPIPPVKPIEPVKPIDPIQPRKPVKPKAPKGLTGMVDVDVSLLAAPQSKPTTIATHPVALSGGPESANSPHRHLGLEWSSDAL